MICLWISFFALLIRLSAVDFFHFSLFSFCGFFFLMRFLGKCYVQLLLMSIAWDLMTYMTNYEKFFDKSDFLFINMYSLLRHVNVAWSLIDARIQIINNYTYVGNLEAKCFYILNAPICTRALNILKCASWNHLTFWHKR